MGRREQCIEALTVLGEATAAEIIMDPNIKTQIS